MLTEFKTLTFLLSKRGDSIGAPTSLLMDVFGLKGESGHQELLHLLEAYERHANLLGLTVKRNPLDGSWFLSHDEAISSATRVNPFKGRTRVGMTLVAILLATILEGGAPTRDKVASVRKKKDISRDLRDLEADGLVRIEGELVHVEPKVGCHVDLESFLAKLKELIEENSTGCTE